MTENTAPKFTDYDTPILVTPVDPDRAEAYGITYESSSVHRVTGAGVFNREFNHTIQVWTNRDGRDPQGNATEAARWITTKAQASVITSRPGEPKIYGEELRTGGTVALIVSDENGVRFLGGFTVEARRMSDPVLVPADEIAEATLAQL